MGLEDDPASFWVRLSLFSDISPTKGTFGSMIFLRRYVSSLEGMLHFQVVEELEENHDMAGKPWGCGDITFNGDVEGVVGDLIFDGIFEDLRVCIYLNSKDLKLDPPFGEAKHL